MSLGDWFGASKPNTSKLGKAEFSAFKRHSTQSFKRAVKKLNYQDRQKALALDKELRGQKKAEISQYQYLKEARKKYGDIYKRRLKENVFTKYSKPTGLSKRRIEMNIYDIQKQREAEEVGAQGFKPIFANQVNTTKTQATAARAGASPGSTIHKSSNQNVDREILGRVGVDNQPSDYQRAA